MAARRSVADDMDADDKAATDPDYLFFLSHLYPDGTTSFVFEVPASDGVSLPVVVKYDRPANDGARGAGAEEGIGDDEPESLVVVDPPPAPDQRRRATGRPATGASKK